MRLGPILLALGATACTAPNPDYAPASGECTVGARECSGRRPIVCEGGDAGAVEKNALCPSAANCEKGLCNPPTNAAPCTRDHDCGAKVCTLFVDAQSGALKGFCAEPEGVTVGGLPCYEAQQCRSNLCLDPPSSQGGTSRCFLACQTDADCPTLDACQALDITVTGVHGSVRGCAPR